jgi:hypothetical protein
MKSIKEYNLRGCGGITLRKVKQMVYIITTMLRRVQ